MIRFSRLSGIWLFVFFTKITIIIQNHNSDYCIYGKNRHNHSKSQFRDITFAAMHYVNVENLTKSFVEKPLFTNISFNIEQGDKIALVAKNGAGKTTLLNVLAGRDFADEGKIWINKDVNVSFLDQDPQFEENKSVIENILGYNHPVINAVREYELAINHHDEKKVNRS